MAAPSSCRAPPTGGDRSRASTGPRREPSARVSAFSGDDALVARVVVSLLDGDLDEVLWDEASRVLSARAVFELSALVGYYGTLALQLRIFRVEA